VIAAPVAGLVALLVLACPQVLDITALLTVGLLALFLVLAGFLLTRRLSGRKQSAPFDRNIAWAVLAPSAEPAQQGFPTTSALIKHLRRIDWFQFEKVVGIAYRNLGYTVTTRGGANPDGGIDLLIEKDGQTSAVQCKQWKTWNVGVKPVREFLGALTDAGMKHGILVTLCGYSAHAKELAEKHGIEILNEAGLARLLESSNAHRQPEVLSVLRDTRKFCPKCERQMVLRKATRGKDAGQSFWGCSAYPRCRFTMPMA